METEKSKKDTKPFRISTELLEEVARESRQRGMTKTRLIEIAVRKELSNARFLNPVDLLVEFVAQREFSRDKTGAKRFVEKKKSEGVNFN